MTEDIISKLPLVLQEHICSLKKTSKDQSNHEYMTESKVTVIDFDKLSKPYSRNKGWSNVPCTNDALYVGSNDWCFIEFKNGSVDKSEIYRKIYDSIILLIEMGFISDFDFSRKSINYILVYNSDKYPKIQKSESRNKINDYILERASQEEKLFGIDKFQGFLFKETHTYTKEMFENIFIPEIE